MSSLKISVAVDQKAALLAGRVLGEREEIEVTPEGIGAEWPALVAMLDMSAKPPSTRSEIKVDDATETAVKSALEKLSAEKAAEARLKAEREAREDTEAIAAVEAYEAAAAGPMSPKTLYTLDLKTISGSGFAFAGFERSLPNCYIPYTGDGRLAPLSERRNAAETRSRAEVEAANEAALVAALPDLERQKAEKEAKDAAEEAAKKAAAKAKFAERLATGKWEKETSSYNERRYGAWWVASVDFSSGAKGDYTFGESTGTWGKAGTLSIDCRPGDFIAYGQKDLRRPDKSDHTVLRMRDDGSMESFDSKAEAYKAYRESQREAAKA